MKKIIYFCIGTFILLTAFPNPEKVSASQETAVEETKEKQMETNNMNDNNILPLTKAGWAENTLLDTDMPQIDYADENKIILHAYFGLFVYDLNQSSIVNSIDLKAINCQKVQTGGKPEIFVNHNGTDVFIHPYQSNDMYIFHTEESTLEKALYQKPENAFENIVSKWDIGKDNLGNPIQLCSDNVIVFSDGTFGYLTIENAYITTIKYIRSDKEWSLFQAGNATLEPLIKQDESYYTAYRKYADNSPTMFLHMYSVFYNMGDYAGICMLSKGLAYTDEEQLIWSKRNASNGIASIRIDEPTDENGVLSSKCHVMNADGGVEELTIDFMMENNKWYAVGLPK